METWEALNRCIGRHSRDVARRFMKSTRLIHAWQEPQNDYGESGAYNPLDKVCDIIDIARSCGQGDDALAPVFYLNWRYNLICFKLPAVEKHDAVQAELVHTIEEFAHLAGATAEAMADGRISLPEARRIEKEGHEALRAISTLLHIVRESVK